jgi:hypothetical protein
VNASNAIINGGLAGKVAFLGASTAEIVGTRGAVNSSSWNGDYAEASYASEPWFLRGVAAHQGAIGGVFAFGADPGGVDRIMGHRTILSGY